MYIYIYIYTPRKKYNEKKKGASWDETLPCIHSQKSESCYIYYIYSLLRDFVFGLPSTTPLPSSCEEVLNIANCRGLLCAGIAPSPPARCCVPLPPLLPIYIYTHTHTHHTHTPHTHTHTTNTTNTGCIFTLCPHARRAPYLPRPRPRPVRDPPRPGT